MRNYPADSPQSMARIVALALMADGAIDRNELNLLDRQAVICRIGVSPEEFDRISYEFFADLLEYGQRFDSGQLILNEAIVASVLDDIRDPALQQKALRLILAIVNADHRLTAEEAGLIAQALKHWQLDLFECSDAAIPCRRSDAGQPRLQARGTPEVDHVYT